MNWDEQIRNIKLGTLFTFFGKSLVASIVWIILMYVVILVPVGIMMAFMTRFFPFR